ncbi:MAG: TonB-dependent receptor [Duganella sp.]
MRSYRSPPAGRRRRITRAYSTSPARPCRTWSHWRRNGKRWPASATTVQPSGEGFALTTANAQIAPEITKNKEIGAKYDLFNGRASAGVSIFQLTRTNIKTTDPLTLPLLPLGPQRTKGVELTFNGDLGNGWNTCAGYSYLDAVMNSSLARDDGQAVQEKRPTLTPKHSATLWVTKALARHFGMGGGVNYVGDRFANPDNTVTLSCYVTVDTMAYYRQRGIDLPLSVMNLFDRAYIVAGHGSSKNLHLPGAPRSVQLTARYRV